MISFLSWDRILNQNSLLRSNVFFKVFLNFTLFFILIHILVHNHVIQIQKHSAKNTKLNSLCDGYVYSH